MGTTQLSNLDEYFSSMGQSATDKGEDPRDTSDQSGEGKTEDPQNGEGKTENPNDGEGSLEKQLEEANRKETETMLDSVSELTEIYNISGLLEVGMDPNGKYIELTINGSVLFDSGKAELKKECLPLLSKVGDILKVYAGHDVEVIGHTDNIPMKSSLY